MRTVVCFGDSNTWGMVPVTDFARPPERLPRERRWPGILEATVPGIHVVEEGLSGRTTVFDDPIEGAHKNGARTLLACIESHAPVALLIFMLGTNDFKAHVGATAFTSARGVLTLIGMVRGHHTLDDGCPEILVVTPASLTGAAEPAFWGDAWRRCDGHDHYLAQVSERTGCFHFDANRVVSVGSDGVHLEPAAHRTLGAALAQQVEAILGLPHRS